MVVMGVENIVARRPSEGSRYDPGEGDEGRVAAGRGADPLVRPDEMGAAPDGRAHLNGRLVCGVTAPRRRETETDWRSVRHAGSPHRPQWRRRAMTLTARFGLMAAV